MKKYLLHSIVALHILWIFLVLLSLPLVFIFPEHHKTILYFIGLTLVSQIPLWQCPLTYFENKISPGRYDGTFMRYYLQKVFGINAKEKTINIITAIYFTTLIFLAVFYKMREA